MANNTTKRPSSPMDKMMTAIITVVIIAVFGLAIFATYGKIAGNLEQKAIEEESTAIANGEKEATVRYMASSMGMDEAAFLEQYGLKLDEGVSGETTMSEMTKLLTVENYYKFIEEGAEEKTDVNTVLADWGADALGITKDTVWSEVEEKLTYKKYVGEEEYNSLIEQYSMYGYDMSAVNGDMTIKEFSDKMNELMAAGPTGTMAPELTEQMEETETAESADSTESAESTDAEADAE